jgi:hypothetical protein
MTIRTMYQIAQTLTQHYRITTEDSYIIISIIHKQHPNIMWNELDVNKLLKECFAFCERLNLDKYKG